MYKVKFRLDGYINISNAHGPQQAEDEARERLFELNAVYYDLRNIDIRKVIQTGNFYCPKCNGELEVIDSRTNQFEVCSSGRLKDKDRERLTEQVRCICCGEMINDTYIVDWSEKRLMLSE